MSHTPAGGPMQIGVNPFVSVFIRVEAVASPALKR
jgi:hypothetical protein